MAPQPPYCAEKARLSDAYLAAMHEVLTLQDQELAEFANGGEGLDQFDIALKAARRKRDAAKTACMEHISVHRC